jgi:crotonobetainyl-CoA:carnitine CoA-transferase CaiB-like acyl-CoA transferase
VSAGPLEGVRVVEAATLFAGPLAGMFLGDLGADVVKIEHPTRPDPARGHGPAKDGAGLWFKMLGRNKRLAALDLSQPAGRDVFLRLAARADVVIENFRPGTLERWGLGFDELRRDNRGLVLARVSGFGQTGPYAGRPGFGTLAEAMSGFAHVVGQPDGPPTLPPFMLADGVASLAATYAVVMALYHRDVHGGEGQLVDVNLIEPLARLIETSTLAYDQLGIVPRRVGNRLDASAPRNAYRTADDQWLAISSASPSIAVRVFRAIDRPDLAEDPDYVDPVSRQERAGEVDDLVAKWVGERTLAEAMATFEAAEVTAAPVYDARQLREDVHLAARGTFVRVDDDDFGPVTVQAPVAQLSGTPGRVEHLGRALGEDDDAVYGGLLGLDAGRLAALREDGVI